MPLLADVGRWEVPKSWEDGWKLVCLHGCSGHPGHGTVVLDLGAWMCTAMCVHSKHLGLKHGPGQRHLRKCPKMSSLGLVAGRPTCQNRSVPQLTHLLSMAAEKVTSLGKDWHRPCLRCEKCNKTLTSGGHAEVRFAAQEVPVPCS